MGLTRVRGPDLWGLQLYLFTPGGRGPGRGVGPWYSQREEQKLRGRTGGCRKQKLRSWGRKDGGRMAKRGRGREPDATGSQGIKGGNTPIESLLDVLGITETQRGRKETKSQLRRDGSFFPV